MLEYESLFGRRKPLHSTPLIALVIGAMLIAVFVRNLLYFTGTSRPLDSGLVSRSRLSYIGKAIVIYSNDNRGRFPDSLGTLLITEDVQADMLVSPLSNDIPSTAPTAQAQADEIDHGKHVSYLYFGKGLTAETANAKDIIACDISGGSVGRMIVLFGDFHADIVGPKDAALILAQISAGKRPVTLTTASTQPN